MWSCAILTLSSLWEVKDAYYNLFSKLYKIQRNLAKNSRNKLKWNTKKYLTNPSYRRGKQRNKNRCKEDRTVKNKLVDQNPIISIITLNVRLKLYQKPSQKEDLKHR